MTIQKNMLLLSLMPHMHYRGKTFRFEAIYPDETKEILLDVPRYDFSWQNRYILAEPKLLPAGTTVRAVAHYDNSKDNPYNPDPSARVETGFQTWDEMFNGYLELALADQDLTVPPPWHEMLCQYGRRLFRPTGCLVIAVICALFLLVPRFLKRMPVRGSSVAADGGGAACAGPSPGC
jgi:hypothetical protein